MIDNLFVVYVTSAFVCPWCEKLKDLLNIYGYDFYVKDISDPLIKKEFIDLGHKTIPQVYINERHIGGYTTTRDYLRNNFFQNHPNKDKIIKELEELDVK